VHPACLLTSITRANYGIWHYGRVRTRAKVVGDGGGPRCNKASDGCYLGDGASGVPEIVLYAILDAWATVQPSRARALARMSGGAHPAICPTGSSLTAATG